MQVTDQTSPLYLGLFVVSEVRAWGIQAFAPVPGKPDEPEVLHRLKHAQFLKVGTVAMATKELTQARALAEQTLRDARRERGR